MDSGEYSRAGVSPEANLVAGEGMYMHYMELQVHHNKLECRGKVNLIQ